MLFLLFIRITAKAMREVLMTKKGWQDENLPSKKTIGNIMNRLDYRLRRVQKAKPIKKVKETDAIFNNLHKVNKKPEESEDSLRISIDTKAKVDLCNSSRSGTSRRKKATQADNHDMGDQARLSKYTTQTINIYNIQYLEEYTVIKPKIFSAIRLNKQMHAFFVTNFVIFFFGLSPFDSCVCEGH